jgi:hypothetical protein
MTKHNANTDTNNTTAQLKSSASTFANVGQKLQNPANNTYTSPITLTSTPHLPRLQRALGSDAGHVKRRYRMHDRLTAYVNISDTTCRLTIALNAVVLPILTSASTAAMQLDSRTALLGTFFRESTRAIQALNGSPLSRANANVWRAVLAPKLTFAALTSSRTMVVSAFVPCRLSALVKTYRNVDVVDGEEETH